MIDISVHEKKSMNVVVNLFQRLKMPPEFLISRLGFSAETFLFIRDNII